MLPSDGPQVISDLKIRDEFASIEPEATLRDIAAILAKNEVKVILLVDRTQREVVGIITEQRFLQACATGVDPAMAVASEYMSTNILRMLGETPLQVARDLIDEKEPDAVIVMAGDRKFRGYLSPEDYRNLRSQTKDPPVIPSKPPIVIADLDIRDEFASLSPEASLRDIAKILAKNEVKVILTVDKAKREVVGIITEQRFLQACATGVDPESAVAHDYMSTNILRLLGDTPLQASRDLIDEKEPDAVIVMSGDRKFRGYLSPEDYRNLRSLTKGAPAIPLVPPSVITDLQIRDEFGSLAAESTLRDVAKILAKNEVKVILIVDKTKREVVGIITEQRFLQSCATGVDPEKALAHDYMSTDILRLLDNTPIQSVINLVEEKEPDAIIVLDQKRKFRGYLSPEDYRQLEGTPLEPVESEDDSGDAITVRFHLGADGPTNRFAVTDECPEGNPLVVGRWGPVLQQALWNILLDIVDDVPPKGQTAAGFSANSDGLMITAGSQTMDLPLDKILRTVRGELGGGHKGPVIWSEDGSEILLHNQSVEGEIQGGDLILYVPVSCDQISQARPKPTMVPAVAGGGRK